MALERLQRRIPFLLDPWQLSYPSRYAAFKLLSYYARRRREYEGTAVRLKGSLLDGWPVVEDESLRIMKES